MKTFITAILMTLSVSAFSADLCFDKITNAIDPVSGKEYANRFVAENSSEGTSTEIALAMVRCMCIQNEIVTSINTFLKNSQRHPGTTVCLVDADVWNGQVMRATGFYVK